MKSTNAEQKVMLSELLQDVCIDLPVKLRKQLAQNDVARLMGVDNTSFSQWITGTRLPTTENIALLAEGLAKYNQKWADRVWEIRGLERPMPKNPRIQKLVSILLDNKTPDEIIDQVIEWVNDDLEKRNNPGTENHTAPNVGK